MHIGRVAFLLSLWLTLSLWLACRNPCGDTALYWDLSAFDLQLTTVAPLDALSDMTLSAGDTVWSDTLWLWLQPEVVYVAAATFELMPRAYARSCPVPGEGGLKDRLTDLRITATVPIAGQAAGSNLTLPAQTHRSNQPFETIDFINGQLGHEADFMGFWLPLTSRPDSAANGRFEVWMQFESGRELRSQSVDVVWP